MCFDLWQPSGINFDLVSTADPPAYESILGNSSGSSASPIHGRASDLVKELSLADLNEQTGIERGTLSKLENDQDPNVTMNTLLRYAEAVGKAILVQLEDVAVV